MSKKTVILIAIAAVLLGYYLSSKIKASFVGTYLSPL